MNRRHFLSTVAMTALGWALLPSRALGDVRHWIVPEYAGSLNEFLFTFDQCDAPHLIREIAAIMRHAPTAAIVHGLVSRERLEEARKQFSDLGLPEIHWVVSDEEGVSGDWGRDTFQLGTDHEGRRTLGVPWYKAAVDREDLDRGWRQLRVLQRDDLSVKLVPAAFEGGNLMIDLFDEERLLFAGSTIAVETRAMMRQFYGSDPGDDGVARILSDALGVDRVVWLGTRQDETWSRQSHYGFHIDMAMTLVSPGVAVVARCDPSTFSEEDHREVLRSEADKTLDALARREELGMAWPEQLALPRDPTEREVFLEANLKIEVEALTHAASEFEGMATRLTSLGYRVHRLDTDPRRVRRFQSHTNAIVTADRMIMPVFPTHARAHGWLLRGDRGRDQVDVDLGLRDSDFELVGDNLKALQLFRSLHPDVRIVRDYFYLASGNVHCVIGRMS